MDEVIGLHQLCKPRALSVCDARFHVQLHATSDGAAIHLVTWLSDPIFGRQSNVVKSTSTRLDVAARSVLHAIQSLYMLVQYCVVHMT